MEFVYARSGAIQVSLLGENMRAAKALKTYNFIRKLYKRVEFPDHTEIKHIRKYDKTDVYSSPDTVQIYTYQDAKKTVRGYITKDMNLHFIATSRNLQPKYPLSLAEGEIVYTTFEDLCQFYEVVRYEATHDYDVYGGRYAGPLFANEHLERLMLNYKPQKRQEFWEHIRSIFRRPKHRKTT